MASCLVSHHHYPLCSSAIFRLLSRESYSSCCTVSAGCPPVCNRLSSCRWLNCSSNSKCRLDNFNFKSRCSVANNDVQFDHVVPEEVQDDTSTMTSGCLFPVHLKSGITEAESLTLLTEDPYIDTLLSTLPILTAEDQKALAATPAHPEGLRALYASCLAGNLVEQLWNFACPAALAMLHPCLQPVAVMSFFIKLSFISGGPLIGKFMDSFPRVPAYNCLIIVQVAAQLLSVAMIIHAYSISPGFESSLLLQPWFAVLVFAVAVERLCGLALAVAMDRDWVVLLAGTNRPIALAQANAILNRIALLCEIAGSTLFGILLSKYDPVTCLKIAAGLMLCSVPVEVILTWLTNKLSAGVLARAKPLHADSGTCKANAECIGRMGLAVIKHGWVEYLHQPVLPASLANVLLYFNVVLAPGSLLTAFLTHRGLNPSVIGGFTGLCAFMGVAATFMSANLVKRLGILKAGALGLTFQASLLTLAVAVYYGGSFKQRASLLFFLILIVLSRIGHMSYDIVGAQILQTGIPSSKANLIGTTEASVASLAELVMLGVAIVANDVSNFGFLAIMSLLSVVGAAWMFWQWLLNPTEEQRNLFSFDPQF